MDGDLLAAIMNFNVVFPVTHPHGKTGVDPRYRVAVALPGYIGITRHLPQLFIDVGIRQPASNGLEMEFFALPSLIHVLMCGAVHALVRDFPDPLPQLVIEVF